MEKPETNQSHPITPPPELVRQWGIASPCKCDNTHWAYEQFIAAEAAQWGADQELEACIAELRTNVLTGAFYVGGDATPSWHHFALKAINKLRAARRPPTPSLKEQALDVLEGLRISAKAMGMGFDSETIRRALELLPDDTTR